MTSYLSLPNTDVPYWDGILIPLRFHLHLGIKMHMSPCPAICESSVCSQCSPLRLYSLARWVTMAMHHVVCKTIFPPFYRMYWGDTGQQNYTGLRCTISQLIICTLYCAFTTLSQVSFHPHLSPLCPPPLLFSWGEDETPPSLPHGHSSLFQGTDSLLGEAGDFQHIEVLHFCGVWSIPKCGLHERPVAVHRNIAALVMYCFGVSTKVSDKPEIGCTSFGQPVVFYSTA